MRVEIGETRPHAASFGNSMAGNAWAVTSASLGHRDEASSGKVTGCARNSMRGGCLIALVWWL